MGSVSSAFSAPQHPPSHRSQALLELPEGSPCCELHTKGPTTAWHFLFLLPFWFLWWFPLISNVKRHKASTLPGKACSCPKEAAGRGPTWRSRMHAQGTPPIAIHWQWSWQKTHLLFMSMQMFDCFLNIYPTFITTCFDSIKQESMGTRLENNLNKTHWAVFKMILLYQHW